MRHRSLVVTVLLGVLVVLAGCTTGLETTDYASGPEEADLSTGGPNEGSAWEVTVTRVIDGDTVEVRFPNGEVDTLRLLGVDTPETTYSRVSPEEFEGIPETTAGRDHLYNWGERAKQFATDELEGQTVRIAVDDQADRRGYYGRLLVYIYTPEGNLNERLLSEGYARMYDSSFSLRSAFRDAEATAQAEKRGLWAFDGSSVTTTTTRAQSTTAGDIPPLPADGDYDCNDFDTQAQAQTVYDQSEDDEYNLDGDGNGVACESLP